jgi:hypothetical protein
VTVRIPLGRSGKFALIDDEDGDYVVEAHWQLDGRGYAFVCGPRPRREHIKLHRVLLAPIPAGMEVDHINRDRLDNRRANLRLVTRSQNTQNSLTHARSGYRGVHQKGSHWRACVNTHRHNQHLGMYNTPEEAARAVDRFNIEHGSLAPLNFPPEPEVCRHCGRVYSSPRKPARAPEPAWLGTDASWQDCINERQDFCPCRGKQIRAAPDVAQVIRQEVRSKERPAPKRGTAGQLSLF